MSDTRERLPTDNHIFKSTYSDSIFSRYLLIKDPNIDECNARLRHHKTDYTDQLTKPCTSPDVGHDISIKNYHDTALQYNGHTKPHLCTRR